MLFQMMIDATWNDKPERCWFRAETPDGETDAAAGDLLGQFWESIAEKGRCLYAVKTLEVKRQISTGEWADDRNVTEQIKEAFLAKCVPGHSHFRTEPRAPMDEGEVHKAWMSSLGKKPGEEKHDCCPVCDKRHGNGHDGSCRSHHAMHLRIQTLEHRIETMARHIEAKGKRDEELDGAGQTPSDADQLLMV